MGNLIDGEVFADSLLMGFPHEGAFCGIELGQERTMTLGGPKRGSVGDRPVEPSSSRVDFGGGGGQSEGGHALAVLHQEWKRGETSLDGQNEDWCGAEAVRDPPRDLSPEGVEPVLHL